MRADHRHAWAVTDLFHDGDRPMVAQACGCGATRTIRAFERYWRPDDADATGDGAAPGQLAPREVTARGR